MAMETAGVAQKSMQYNGSTYFKFAYGNRFTADPIDWKYIKFY